MGESAGTTSLGVVVELWRYPVKSLGGERVDMLACDERGIAGDRRFAVVGADGKIGSGKTTRRFRRMPGLLMMSAETDRHGEVWIRLPDGSRRRAGDAGTDDAVSRALGEPVHLAEEGPVPHLDDSPVHLVTTGAMSALSEQLPHVAIGVRRFRPNIVIDSVEDWCAPSVRIRDALLRVSKPTERCVMVTMAQLGLPFAPRVLGRIEKEHGGFFGLYAEVEVRGTIRLGDLVFRDEPEERAISLS